MLTVLDPKRFDWAGITLHDCCEGNAADSYFTLKLFNLFEEVLEGQGSLPLMEKVISPALSIFSEMELAGLDVSTKHLELVGRQLNEKTVNETDSLYQFTQVQNTDNLSSNNDLIEILYTREEGFELYPPDRTAKASPSVAAPTLKLLLEHINEELAKRL